MVHQQGKISQCFKLKGAKMRDCIRLCTVICVVGIIASMGGFEHGQYSLAGMFGRMAIFSLMAGVCVVLDEVLTQRKRARVRHKVSTTAVCRRNEAKRSDCVQMRATVEREQAVEGQKKKASGKCEFPKAQRKNKYEVICHE